MFSPDPDYTLSLNRERQERLFQEAQQARLLQQLHLFKPNLYQQALANLGDVLMACGAWLKLRSALSLQNGPEQNQGLPIAQRKVRYDPITH